MEKKLNFLSLLLLSNFNNNIISMQSSNKIDTNEINTINLQAESNLENIPEEARQLILGHLINTNKLDKVLEKIKSTKDIFELYSLNVYDLLKILNNIRLTSRQLQNSAQYYTDKLKTAFKEKALVFVNKIKEKYYNISKDELNNRLINILNSSPNIDALKQAVILIIAGANVNTKDRHGHTALILSSMRGYVDIIQLLLDKGANINDVDSNGWTALIWAIRKASNDIVELLLNKGADTKIQNKSGNNALIWSVIEGRNDVVELLLNKGADVNVKNNRGDTALMLAAIEGNTNIVKLLLNKNADIKTKNKDGKTALMFAREGGKQDIIKLIEENINSNAI